MKMNITYIVLGTLVVAVAIAAYSFYQQRSLAQCVRQLLDQVQVDDAQTRGHSNAPSATYPVTTTHSIVPSQDAYAGKPKASMQTKQPAVSLADSIMSMSKPFEHE